jgi:hypothetical protein
MRMTIEFWDTSGNCVGKVIDVLEFLVPRKDELVITRFGEMCLVSSISYDYAEKTVRVYLKPEPGHTNISGKVV